MTQRPRRQVRIDPFFFEALDRQLPAERSERLPSAHDFAATDLIAISRIFAVGWEDLPPLIESHRGYRQWIGITSFAGMVVVEGQLASDGAVELVSIEFDFEGLPDPGDHEDFGEG